MPLCLLEEKGLLKKAEAVYTAIYIKNRGMSKVVKDITPHVTW